MKARQEFSSNKFSEKKLSELEQSITAIKSAMEPYLAKLAARCATASYDGLAGNFEVISARGRICFGPARADGFDRVWLCIATTNYWNEQVIPRLTDR